MRCLAGEPGAAERYLDFLKSGGSRYPLDALQTGRRRPDQPRAGRARLRRAGRAGGPAGGSAVDQRIIRTIKLFNGT